MPIGNRVGVLVGVTVGLAVVVRVGVLLGDGVALEVWIKLGTTVVALGEKVTVSFTPGSPLGLHPLARKTRLNPRDIPAIALTGFLFLPIIRLMLNNIRSGCLL